MHSFVSVVLCSCSVQLSYYRKSHSTTVSAWLRLRAAVNKYSPIYFCISIAPSPALYIVWQCIGYMRSIAIQRTALNCPDTSAPVPKCLLDTSELVPKCLGTEVSWVRSVRLPGIAQHYSSLLSRHQKG